MRRAILAVCLSLAALLALAGCDAGGTPDDQAAPDDVADVSIDYDSMLPSDGVPDRDAVLQLYRRIVELVRNAEQDKPAEYVFDPEELQQIANLGIGLPVDQAWEVIFAELKRRYPDKIADEMHWTFNHAGNLCAEIALVYASTNEYVAFFGTPMGGTGFSGRYMHADVWDLMIDGEMWNYVPGQFERTVSLPGDTAYLPQGTGKGVVYVDHAWMIDYARGDIITMFPYGVLAPMLFTTLDYQSAWEQFTDFAELVLKNLFD